MPEILTDETVAAVDKAARKVRDLEAKYEAYGMECWHEYLAALQELQRLTKLETLIALIAERRRVKALAESWRSASKVLSSTAAAAKMQQCADEIDSDDSSHYRAASEDLKRVLALTRVDGGQDSEDLTVRFSCPLCRHECRADAAAWVCCTHFSGSLELLHIHILQASKK